MFFFALCIIQAVAFGLALRWVGPHLISYILSSDNKSIPEHDVARSLGWMADALFPMLLVVAVMIICFLSSLIIPPATSETLIKRLLPKRMRLHNFSEVEFTAGVLSCAIFLILLTGAWQDNRTKTTRIANPSKTNIVANNAKVVALGQFTIQVPSDWANFSPGEADVFRRQVMKQSKQLYEQYSGATDTTKFVDVAAFHVLDDAGSFVIDSITVPPQSDVINLLKSQIDDKMKWGVREGYISKYLGLVPIDDEQFTGFYTRALGKDGGFEISGGMCHKKLSNTIIHLTLLCPNAWDEAKSTNTLLAVLSARAKINSDLFSEGECNSIRVESGV